MKIHLTHGEVIQAIEAHVRGIFPGAEGRELDVYPASSYSSSALAVEVQVGDLKTGLDVDGGAQ